MIFTDTDGKTSLKSPEQGAPAPEQNPPPYSPRPQGSSANPAPPDLPPELAPSNYIHLKEKNNTLKQKILLDLSVPRPPANALPEGTPSEEDRPHLLLDSHNGSVFGEVWVLRANRQDITAAREGDKPLAARERVHLHFRSHNGAVKALVHVHPSTVEPRPFLNINVNAHNGSVAITIPRSFRGQLMLHSENGRVHLSSALAPRAATLSTLNGTHTYFVGERPTSGMWHTGESEDGEEVDGVIGSSKNGSVKVSYDDEDARRGPGVLSSLFKAMGF